MTEKYTNTRSNVYATRNDFCHIYIEEMNGLFLLSLLLTGDPQKAEQCFLSGFEDSVRNNYVFKERAHSWARRSIMLQAIRLLCSRPFCIHHVNPGEVFRAGVLLASGLFSEGCH